VRRGNPGCGFVDYKWTITWRIQTAEQFSETRTVDIDVLNQLDVCYVWSIFSNITQSCQSTTFNRLINRYVIISSYNSKTRRTTPKCNVLFANGELHQARGHMTLTRDVKGSLNFRTSVSKSEFKFDLHTFSIQISDWNLSTIFTL